LLFRTKLSYSNPRIGDPNHRHDYQLLYYWIILSTRSRQTIQWLQECTEWLLARPTIRLVCTDWGAVLVSKHCTPYSPVGYLTSVVQTQSQPNKDKISSHSSYTNWPICIKSTSLTNLTAAIKWTSPLQAHNIPCNKSHVPSPCLGHTKVLVQVRGLHYECLVTRYILTCKRC
jgi:hypothetical protein